MTLWFLVTRNLLRRPLRLVLTVLPMCLAFVGFSIIIGIDNAYDVEYELDEKQRVVTINRQSIVQPLNESSVARIRELPHTTAVTFVTWFGGYFQKPDQVFSQYAVDLDSYFKVFPDIQLSAEAEQVWLQDPRAVLITPQLAARFNWRPGDKITLTTSIWTRKNFSNDWTFIVAGEYTPEAGTEPEALLLKHKFLDQNRLFGRGLSSFFVTRVADGVDTVTAMNTIDALFENSKTPTFTSKESSFAESFRRQLGDLALMTKLVLAIAILVVFLLTSSSMAQSVVERKRELAIFSAIGFSRLKIAALLLAENILIVCAAMTIAVVVTGVTAWSLQALLTDGPFADIELRTGDILQIAAVAVSLGMAGAFFPLLQVLRKDLAIHLKSAV
ncbi:ABC transporter permease [Rheinheimera riviphila]|uniref:ABC transporter permease n=1 Tax=Rheinheimera riviphila TaxID=1834037 RepID=A0A437R5L8_9GAMM|nr:ABC transporter permease [Rheinheimera riviphila]RVU41967.1 ABC transporter permease [Rheinheimera riviphila]